MATAATNLRRLFTLRGWPGCALAGLSRILHRHPRHPFDRRHGVDTGGLLYADRLASGHAHDTHNAGYYATAPSLFNGAIDLWRNTLPAAGCTVSDYTLIDIGCGKGRALMLASAYEFPQIVGIELNPRLARIARKNLRKWSRVDVARNPERCEMPPVSSDPAQNPCHPDADPELREGEAEGPAFLFDPAKSLEPAPRIRIIEADALSIPIPDAPVAFFYFNSFERALTEKWLSRLAEVARHRTAPLDLIYIHPEFDRLVQQVPGVRVVAEAEIPFSDEDAGADAFGVSSDQCSVYRWNGS